MEMYDLLSLDYSHDQMLIVVVLVPPENIHLVDTAGRKSNAHERLCFSCPPWSFQQLFQNPQRYLQNSCH